LAGGQNPWWFHAASVGETRSAVNIIRALSDYREKTQGLQNCNPLTRPLADLELANELANVEQASLATETLCDDRLDFYVLSVGTPAGLERAENLSLAVINDSLLKAKKAPRIQVMAPPLDFWGAPSRSLDRVAPRALIIVETELWPDLIHQAQKRRIPVMIVAGRLSQKSLRRYLKVRSFFEPLLAQMALIAVISEADKHRFMELGAPSSIIRVVGNPKFDPLIQVAKETQTPFDCPFGKNGSQKVIIAGSTAEDEERLIVEAWVKLKEKTQLILCPRHLGRLKALKRYLKDFLTNQGMVFRLFSDIPCCDWGQSAGKEPDEKSRQNWPDLILVDRLGVLAQLYGSADLAIIGGSFFAGQGHNPLEPAAYGVPIIFGPHMSSFAEEAQSLIEAHAALRVCPSDLPAVLAQWLERGEEFLSGQAAREFLAKRDLVGPRLAALVGRALNAPLTPDCPDIHP
jgi:3-deoxy-D-manno-octulosonic-acid transferase